MSKNLDIKKQAVAEIVEKFQNAKSVVIADTTGMTVAEVTDLRAKFRAGNVEYKVLKNTLVKRALAELKIEGLDDTLNGPSVFAFSNGDEVTGAKIIQKFIDDDKDHHKLTIKAGLVDGAVLDAAGVKALAALPPKEQLIAKLMGTLNAPSTNFVGVLAATLRQLVYALEAIRKSKEGAE